MTSRLLNSLDIPTVTEVMINHNDIVVLLTQDDRSALLVVQLPGMGTLARRKLQGTFLTEVLSVKTVVSIPRIGETSGMGATFQFRATFLAV